MDKMDAPKNVALKVRLLHNPVYLQRHHIFIWCCETSAERDKRLARMYGVVPNRGDLLNHQLEVRCRFIYSHSPCWRPGNPSLIWVINVSEENTSTLVTSPSRKPINPPILAPSRLEANILIDKQYPTHFPPYQARATYKRALTSNFEARITKVSPHMEAILTKQFPTTARALGVLRSERYGA